jgi:hypothetical protein
MFRALKVLCFYTPLAALGCSGSISSNVPSDFGGTGPGGGGPTPSSTVPSKPGPGALSDADTVPGLAPVRRLNKTEYAHTLRDLLGAVPPTATVQLVEDAESGNAGFLRGGVITGGDDVRNMMTASQQIADSVVAKLGTLLPCAPLPSAQADQDACVVKFIAQFGKRAYRRPLTQHEADLLHTLYTTQRSVEVGATFEKAVSTLIGAIVQSPQLLYHWELGSNAPLLDGKLVRFNSYEIASRLSYMFWASMPDDQLLAAADANMLSTPDQIAGAARRLLADPKAKDGLADFHLQWTEIGSLTQTPKDDTVKNFSPAIAQAMMDETRDFTASLYQGKDPATLEALLTSTSTVVDPSVAAIYGVKVSGTGPQAATLDGTQRSGIFTRAAFLTSRADTSESHPVKRGDTVLRRVLCTEFQMPANVNIPPVADPTPGGATTRERYAMHSMNPCATCHQMLDPVGFAFEEYDTVGAFRTTDQGHPVDSTGKLSLPSGVLEFKNAVDLSAQLAKLPQVQDCMARQWMRYMTGRREVDESTPAQPFNEKPSLAAARDAFGKSNNDLRELMVALTRTRSFTHRSIAPGEVTK